VSDKEDSAYTVEAIARQLIAFCGALSLIQLTYNQSAA